MIRKLKWLAKLVIAAVIWNFVIPVVERDNTEQELPRNHD